MNTELVRANGDDAEKSEARLIFALARGASLRTAAAESGFSVSTVRRRLVNSEFRERVTRARGQLIDRACGILGQATIAAARGLKKLTESKDESVRLQACRTILDLSAKYRDQAEILQRLEALEATS